MLTATEAVNAQKAIRDAVLRERERCARLVEVLAKDWRVSPDKGVVEFINPVMALLAVRIRCGDSGEPTWEYSTGNFMPALPESGVSGGDTPEV